MEVSFSGIIEWIEDIHEDVGCKYEIVWGIDWELLGGKNIGYS